MCDRACERERAPGGRALGPEVSGGRRGKRVPSPCGAREKPQLRGWKGRFIKPAGACLAREDPPPWFSGPGTGGRAGWGERRQDSRKRSWGYGAETTEKGGSPCPARWVSSPPGSSARAAGARPNAPSVRPEPRESPRVCPRAPGVLGLSHLFSSLLQATAKGRGLGGETRIALRRRGSCETP